MRRAYPFSAGMTLRGCLGAVWTAEDSGMPDGGETGRELAACWKRADMGPMPGRAGISRNGGACLDDIPHL